MFPFLLSLKRVRHFERSEKTVIINEKKMNKIEDLILQLCPNGLEFKELGEVAGQFHFLGSRYI
jgi:hypothetical protein